MMTMNSCSGQQPESVGQPNQGLSECPNSPNCVSSQAKDEKHRIEPFQLKGNIQTTWPKVIEAVNSIPRSTIVTQSDTYLHAEAKSLIFRFVDDVELLLDTLSGRVDVRSASRTGYSDMGANRKRVEALRQALKNKGFIE